MKKVSIAIVTALSLIVLTSCSVLTNKGKTAVAEEKGRAKIANVDNAIAVNNVDKLDVIASLAYGTDYALSKIAEPSREVEVARDINQRVVSIAGSPAVDKMKEMQQTIDDLTSTLVSEREQGKQTLSKKDQEISDLQIHTKELEVAKQTEIRKYMAIAQEAAANADAYKVEIDKMNRWLGLGAVWYGLKKFVISSMWILGIGSILFIILRLVSYSNPVAASIFSIFSTIASWFIRGIEALVPKAVEYAGHVSSGLFNTYKSTLWKIVDGVQISRDRATAAGKTPSIEDVLDEISKSMNSDEKAIVEQIKKALNWK